MAVERLYRVAVEPNLPLRYGVSRYPSKNPCAHNRSSVGLEILRNVAASYADIVGRPSGEEAAAICDRLGDERRLAAHRWNQGRVLHGREARLVVMQ